VAAMAMVQQQQRHDLGDTIQARHSTRKFLATHVPRALPMEALSFKECAHLNSNMWKNPHVEETNEN
jgi:hypothetical protein